MIDVSTEIKAAFQSDSVLKHYHLEFPKNETKPTITIEGEENSNPTGFIDYEEEEEKSEHFYNQDIKNESITITESICSEEQLKFGCCEASMFEVEMFYDPKKVTGKIFNVYLQLGDYSLPDQIFKVGRYIVDSEEVSNNEKTRKITAYDVMYVLKLLNVAYWYYMNITFPITIKDLRDSLLEYVNLEQVERTLINDDAVLEYDPLYGETDISFETIMTGICEVNACFGHINREGKFDYVTLTAPDQEETYPSKETFPSRETFPQSIRSKNYYIKPQLIKSDIEWQNYMCKPVDIVQVRSRNGSVLLEYHDESKETYTNIYVIQNNWITDAFTNETLQTVTKNFYDAIAKVTYTPCDANIKMDLSLEVGDAITLTSTDKTRIPTYIFKRTMTGIHSAFDEIEATGYEEWVNDPPSTDGMYSELMDGLNELTDRVDNMEQQIDDSALSIVSVEKLPEAPKKNVLYLIQGRIGVY